MGKGLRRDDQSNTSDHDQKWQAQEHQAGARNVGISTWGETQAFLIYK